MPVRGTMFKCKVSGVPSSPSLMPRSRSSGCTRRCTPLSQTTVKFAALLHRFPYSLVYEFMTPGEIVILACRHVRQDEINWSAARRDV